VLVQGALKSQSFSQHSFVCFDRAAFSLPDL
jgi:hypothetical protein